MEVEWDSLPETVHESFYTAIRSLSHLFSDQEIANILLG